MIRDPTSAAAFRELFLVPRNSLGVAKGTTMGW